MQYEQQANKYNTICNRKLVTSWPKFHTLRLVHMVRIDADPEEPEIVHTLRYYSDESMVPCGGRGASQGFDDVTMYLI